jgi:hypothetical protein
MECVAEAEKRGKKRCTPTPPSLFTYFFTSSPKVTISESMVCKFYIVTFR